MFKLVRTCTSHPEQYDVYFNDEEVGYLRLRHGIFSAEYKDKTVFRAAPKGDGEFFDDERDEHLSAACKAIRNSMFPADYEVE